MVSSSTTSTGSTKKKQSSSTSAISSPKKITKKNSSSPSSPLIALTQPAALEATLSQVLPKQRKEYTIQQKREKWSDDEHDKFLEAIRIHGRDWKKVEDFIGTKTRKQIRSHAQKHFEKMKKNGEEFPAPRAKRKSLKPYPSKKTNEIYNALSNDQIVSNLKKIPTEFFEKLISHHDVSETIRLVHLLVTASASNDDKERSAAIKSFSEKERNLIRTVIHNAAHMLSSTTSKNDEEDDISSNGGDEEDDNSSSTNASSLNNHHLLFLTSLFTNFTDFLSTTATTSENKVSLRCASPSGSSSSHSSVCSSSASTETPSSSFIEMDQGSAASMVMLQPQPHDDFVVFSSAATTTTTSTLQDEDFVATSCSPTTCSLSESDSEFSPSLGSDEDDEKMFQLISDFNHHQDEDTYASNVLNHQHHEQQQHQPQYCNILPSPFSNQFYTTPTLYIPNPHHHHARESSDELSEQSYLSVHHHLNQLQMNILHNSLMMMNVVVGGGANFENLLENAPNSTTTTGSGLFDQQQTHSLLNDDMNVNSIFESF